MRSMTPPSGGEKILEDACEQPRFLLRDAAAELGDAVVGAALVRCGGALIVLDEPALEHAVEHAVEVAGADLDAPARPGRHFLDQAVSVQRAGAQHRQDEELRGLQRRYAR